MPTVSYDGQSFLVDGRRVWLVSGAIHYTRTPPELWRSRIRAARQAGLNCIETYVFWNVHEPRPGVFHFQGNADLRRFVQMIAQEGLYCILRPGPYICAEWDFGGLPAWLHRVEGLRLRQANGPFLEACARYLGAVLEQVRDLQVSSPDGGPGGPIIMMQAENEWFCHNPQQAHDYLRELVRYLRESGCAVPINVCNGLWQRVEGAIDTWNGEEHLLEDLRQLRVVQPSAPPLVTEYWPGWFDSWGAPHHTAKDADTVLYRLASILAAGAQYNLYMFHGGTNFAFWGGRTVARPDCFMTTSYDYDAPLLEAGGRGPKYRAVKRISTFASQFGQVFAHLSPAPPHAAIALTDREHGLSLLHLSGAQGQVVFLVKSKHDASHKAEVLLPNGLTLPVPLAADRVAWLLVNANLGGVAELNYTNLRPWAFLGKRMLVLFGPPGADGLVSIDGAVVHLTVPTGQTPSVTQHEELTLVVLNTAQVDAAYIAPGLLPTRDASPARAAGPQGDCLYVGAAGLDEQDKPLRHPDWPSVYRIDYLGGITRLTLRPIGGRGRDIRGRGIRGPRLGKWRQARLTDMLSGASERFLPIDGPQSLEQLKCDYGYGWYRLIARSPSPRISGRVLAPLSGDRLHIFQHGRAKAVMGLGPGASFDPVRLGLRGTTVVLADNLGRFNFGWNLGESKGLFGHLYAVRPLALPRHKIVPGHAPDPFVLSGHWTGLRRGEHPPADALVWNIRGGGIRGRGIRGRAYPVILDIRDLPLRVMIFVNGKPLALYDLRHSAGFGRYLLDLKPGRNELKLALFEKFPPPPPEGQVKLARFIRLYEATHNLTAKAQWAFAPWTPGCAPGAADGGEFGPIRRGHAGEPCWYRAQFNVSTADVPLWLEPNGMSKGQIYINGHNAGRYFVSTAKSGGGQAVPPQKRYYLPEPWLHTDKPNELLLFDEHGHNPKGCRLVYDALGPYGGE